MSAYTPHRAILNKEGIVYTMSNKMYDILVYIAQIVLPALGTLYFALCGIWGFPYGEEIIGTITAVDIFLGTILKISQTKYYKELEHEKGE